METGTGGILSLRNPEYVVTWNGKKHAVMQTSATTYLVDGKEHIVDFLIRGDHVSTIIDNKVYSVQYLLQDANDQDQTHENIRLSVNGITQVVLVDDQRSMLRKSLERNDGKKQSEIHVCSPMPGLVVKVEVGVGEEVSKDGGLVVLEAMKMENELRSPQKGRISSIYVKAGQTVERGQKLLTLNAL